jgi:hypothetical protein
MILERIIASVSPSYKEWEEFPLSSNRGRSGAARGRPSSCSIVLAMAAIASKSNKIISSDVFLTSNRTVH